VNTWPYGNNYAGDDIPGWAAYFNDRLAAEARDEVLGIGHDAGGLILRYMDMMQQEPNLAAMILAGVPNQGSKALQWVLPATPGEQSGAQQAVQILLDRQAQVPNCRSCNMIEASQRWINSFVATPQTRDFYQRLKPDAPTITNLQAPDIPFAIIWGNEDDDALALTRLMSSWHNTALFGEDYEYIECYRRAISGRVLLAQQTNALGLLESMASMAGVARTSNLTNPDFGPVEGAVIRERVLTLKNAFVQNELRNILECEFVHRALDASWTLAIVPYSTQQFVIEEPCLVGCDWCWEDFLIDKAVHQYGYCLAACDRSCTRGNSTYAFTYLVPEPHDGLLTQSEQSLTGAAKSYEAKGSNHLQEQFWEYAPVRNAFVDLFNGNAGAAFVVPK
jgi:hypothetical protein